METLAELISRRKRELAASYDYLALRARQAGYQITYGGLAHLAKTDPGDAPKRKAPEADTVRALAVALEVPERDVWLAAGVSMGLKVHEGAIGDVVVMTTGPRSVTQVAELRRAVRRAATDD